MSKIICENNVCASWFLKWFHCKKSFVIMDLVLIFFAGCVMTACGGKKPDPVPQWIYQPKAIEISYHANNMLNEFNGASHVLQAVIYQLSDINKFMELAAYKDGLQTLLKGQNFDPSVQAVKKVFINPGEDGNLVLTRAEKCKWVGIVAGFFDLTPGRVTCFFEIPSKVEEQGIIFKKKVAVVMDLKAAIYFTEHDLKKINSNEIKSNGN